MPVRSEGLAGSCSDDKMSSGETLSARGGATVSNGLAGFAVEKRMNILKAGFRSFTTSPIIGSRVMYHEEGCKEGSRRRLTRGQTAR